MYIAACYRFLEYLSTVKNASPHTIRNYTIDLNALKNYLEQEHTSTLPQNQKPEKISYCIPYTLRDTSRDSILPIEIVTRTTIRGFLAHEHDQQSSKKTVVRRLSSLRTFFNFCTKSKLISINPTEGLDRPKIDKHIPPSLSYDQIQIIFDQPDTSQLLGFRDRVMMELFYSSGLRVSELVGLNRNDFDPENMLIKVRGKGKKERIVPITKNAAQWITAYLQKPERYISCDGHLAEQDPEAIFLNRLGLRISLRSVDRKFLKYLTASGLSGNITPHTIRHTIATHWLENGMDLKMIQTILGHSSLSTTTIYTQVSTKLKKEVHEKAHPRA